MSAFKNSHLIYECWFAGKGTQIWKKTGAIYDGDWKDSQRCGFGTLSFPDNDVFRKVYSGGWKNDKRHVRFFMDIYITFA